MGFWVVFTRLNRHLTIILKRNKEQGSFIQRKKDELAVAIVAAILGALIGIAGTVLVTTYLKK